MFIYYKIITSVLTLIMLQMLTWAQSETSKIAGLIYPEIMVTDEFDEVMHYPRYKNYPSKELKLYTTPGVYANKYIKSEQTEYKGRPQLKTSLVDETGNETQFTYRSKGEMVWTRFKSYNLMYYETKDDFIKTKVNGTFYWLNKSQIANFGYTNLTWKDYFQNFESIKLVVTCNLNLREQPNKDSKWLFTIGNDYDRIQTTGNFVGQWAEVVVTVYNRKQNICSLKKVDKKITGWIKFLDDNGKPNIRGGPTRC